MTSIEAYCVKCKSKQEMKEAQIVTQENGRRVAKGKCPVASCGINMTKFLPSEKK